MSLTGDVNYALYFKGSVSLAPEEDGYGGLVVPTTDGSGIPLSVGDLVRFPNPTPGQNGLPNQPELFGVIFAFGGSLFTANVPSSTQLSTAVAVYNIPCSQAFQLYSGTSPANAESTPAL